MSDQDNKKDALERLFRQKAEEYDIEYNEKDWQKLEDRLDNLDQQQTHRIRRRMIAAVVVLAFSILAYLTVENHLRINKLNNRISSTNSNHYQESVEPESKSNTINKTESPVRNDNKLPANQHPSSKKDRQKLILDKQKRSSTSKINDKETAGRSNQNLISVKKIEAYDLTSTVANLKSSDDITKLPETQDYNIVKASARHKPTISVVVRNSPKYIRASLGIVLGPDLSTAGSIANFYDPGYKLGFIFDYNFNTDFGISTGIVRTRTRYLASRGDYHLPRGYLSNGTAPDQTEGDCILLDIPISLKYNFLHFKHSHFYATAGLSSYIMLNEKYHFEYGNYQPGTVHGWSGKTGTRYWLSNATLSVGYEMDIVGNWSLRAEPFIKIPLKQVGWGKVDLYSMGTVVSLNFNIRK